MLTTYYDVYRSCPVSVTGIEEERLKEELRKIVACTTREPSASLDRISDAGSVVPQNITCMA